MFNSIDIATPIIFSLDRLDFREKVKKIIAPAQVLYSISFRDMERYGFTATLLLKNLENVIQF